MESIHYEDPFTSKEPFIMKTVHFEELYHEKPFIINSIDHDEPFIMEENHKESFIIKSIHYKKVFTTNSHWSGTAIDHEQPLIMNSH